MSVERPAEAGLDGTMDGYRKAIGRARTELVTPALILDLEVLRRNIAVMAEWTKNHAKIRPHTKVHKCAEIARLQVEAGALGVTTATVWEALAMANAGFDHILIANEVAGEEKLNLLAEAARETDFLVAVDHPGEHGCFPLRQGGPDPRSEFWSRSILAFAVVERGALRTR
jgi:D-serine deaminase-like pyridoxal phosphate-dependent protein